MYANNCARKACIVYADIFDIFKVRPGRLEPNWRRILTMVMTMTMMTITMTMMMTINGQIPPTKLQNGDCDSDGDCDGDCDCDYALDGDVVFFYGNLPLSTTVICRALVYGSSSARRIGIWHPRRGWMQPTAGIGWLPPQMQAQTPLTLRSPATGLGEGIGHTSKMVST